MSNWLTVVLPGSSYGPLGAVLRLPCLVLEGAGARTVTVEYPSEERADLGVGELLASTGDQITRAIAAERATRVTFVAKSLGTAILAGLDPGIVATADAEAIWLTPLFGEPDVRRAAMRCTWPSLLVAGDADHYHDPDGYETVRAALDADSLVIPDADHSLEIEGDVHATLDALGGVVDAVARFSGVDLRPSHTHRS